MQELRVKLVINGGVGFNVTAPLDRS